MSDKKLSVRASTSRTVIWDIAQRSGVSIATVSRVLNGRPDVSAATRDKVLHHIQELGYVPERRIAGRTAGRTTYIGFTAPQLRSPYFGRILEGATDAIEARGARLIVSVTQSAQQHEQKLVQQLERDGVEGLLLLHPSQSQQELTQLRQRGYPFVVIDPFYRLNEDIPVVAVANISGARMATEHLVSLGHTCIGVITGVPECCATVDRLAGYHSILIGAGIVYRPELVIEGDFTPEGGYAATQQLLALPNPPTAIFAMNDNMAIAALQAAQERGLHVPDDLSIVGFDDGEFASFVTPTLTTVRHPLKELGRVGIETLFRLIQGQTLEATRIELSTRLIVRASTAICKQNTPRS